MRASYKQQRVPTQIRVRVRTVPLHGMHGICALTVVGVVGLGFATAGAWAGEPAREMELGVPLELPAVGAVVWGTPASWGMVAVTHRPASQWIPRPGEPEADDFITAGRDRHAAVPCDLDRDGQDELIVSVGSERGKGHARPEVWALEDGRWVDRAETLFPAIDGLRGRGVSCADLDGDGRPEVGLFGFKGPIPDLLLRWDGAAWHDVAAAWGLALSADTHGARFDDLDGDGDLDALRLVNRRLSMLTQEPGPRFVERPEALATMVAGFLPIDAENDGDIDLFCARGGPPSGDAVGADGFRLELDGADEDEVGWRAPPGCDHVVVTVAGDLGGHPARIRLGSAREARAEVSFGEDVARSGNGAASTLDGWLNASTRELWLHATGPGEVLRGSVRCVGGGVLQPLPASLDPREPPRPTPDLLLLNDGAGHFVPSPRAIPAPQTVRFAGRPVVADIDLDGDADVLLITGDGFEVPGNAADTLLLNDGHGAFKADPSFPEDHRPESGSVGLAADLDGDRYPDLIVVNSEAPAAGRAFVWHNPGGDNHWIEAEVYDRGGKARSLAAKVEVRAGAVTQRRSSQPYPDFRVNGNLATVFGIGPETSAEVHVRWPDGAELPWARVVAGTTTRLVHP